MKSPDARDNKYLSTREVADLRSIYEKMVYSLVSEKGMPATKITRKWLFPRHLLDTWFNAHIPRYRSAVIERYSARSMLIMTGSDDSLLQRTLSLLHFKHRGRYFWSIRGSAGCPAAFA